MKNGVKDQIIDTLDVSLNVCTTREEAVNTAHKILNNLGVQLAISTIDRFYDVTIALRNQRFTKLWDLSIQSKQRQIRYEKSFSC